MLANLLSLLGVHFFIEQWFKKTLCVSYFIKTPSGLFTIWTVNKSDTMCYLIYWVEFGCIWSLNSNLSRNYLLAILLSEFLKVNKADTMCWLIYWVDYGYIWSLNSDLSRHSVLDILLSGFLRVNKVDTLCWLFTGYYLCSFFIWPVNKADTMCYLFYWVYLEYIQ